MSYLQKTDNGLLNRAGGQRKTSKFFFVPDKKYFAGNYGFTLKKIEVLPYPPATIQKAVVRFVQITHFLLDLGENRHHQWIPH